MNRPTTPEHGADGKPAPPTETPVRELSLEDAVRMAIQLQMRGALDPARTLFERVLALAPDHPDALHFLGILEHQRGDGEQGLKLLRRSLELTPNEPGRHLNHGNVQLERGDVEGARRSYERALELAPGNPQVLNNLGALYRQLDLADQAEAAYRGAIAADADFIDAYQNLGHLLLRRGREGEAVPLFHKAFTLDPRNARARLLMGIAYAEIGEIDKATLTYQRWLEEEPDNAIARHMLAACSPEPPPARAADDYVEKTFDSFAASFDAKLAQLGYQAPELVVQALMARMDTSRTGLSVLDAGCGTGLCGPLIKPRVARLTGVDLSSGMLAKAEARGCYDTLTQAELTGFLQQHPDQYDAVVSADTLCYFGTLDDVARAACDALKPGGLFAFTVEACDDDIPAAGYRIQHNGRYSHARGYLERVLATAGFRSAELTRGVLRQENARPVQGFIVTAIRA